MATIQTVSGPIEAGEMGLTLVHEHVRFRDEAAAVQWPDRYDADAELQLALEAVNAAAAHGVRTIIDPTAMFGGRGGRFIERVGRAAGGDTAPATGLPTPGPPPPPLPN